MRCVQVETVPELKNKIFMASGVAVTDQRLFYRCEKRLLFWDAIYLLKNDDHVTKTGSGQT